MKIYSAHGVNDFIICLGYKGYVIKEYFANYFLHMSDVTFHLAENRMDVHRKTAEPWNVTLVDTGDATQTGGRLKRVLPFVGDEPFFALTYGDGIADVDIASADRIPPDARRQGDRDGRAAGRTLRLGPTGGQPCHAVHREARRGRRLDQRRLLPAVAERRRAHRGRRDGVGEGADGVARGVRRAERASCIDGLLASDGYAARPQHARDRMGERQGEMENLVIDPKFWAGRRVLLTGHTGFKGAWIVLLLRHLGAHVTGFALAPLDPKDLFEVADGKSAVDKHILADICAPQPIADALHAAQPGDRHPHGGAVAGAPLLRRADRHLCDQRDGHRARARGGAPDAERPRGRCHHLDKCYENVGWVWGYRENDRLGGHDPYSNSKACAEFVTDAYRSSFFGPGASCQVASARAGNVIGGGDWARDRLVPDAMRAFMANVPLRIRNPNAVRPWQHVLDPVRGLSARSRSALAERRPPVRRELELRPLGGERSPGLATSCETLVTRWGDGVRWEQDVGEHPHEAAYLKLDCAKAAARLGWHPLIELEQALELTVEWYRADMRALTLEQMRRVLDL